VDPDASEEIGGGALQRRATQRARDAGGPMAEGVDQEYDRWGRDERRRDQPEHAEQVQGEVFASHRAPPHHGDEAQEPGAQQPFHPSFASHSSSDRGQSSLSKRDNARSARTRPPVWHVAQ